MAKVFVLPIIRESEYRAFRRAVGPNLCDAYDEWRKLFENAVAEVLRRGDSVVEIEVQHGDFVEFCHTEGHEPDLKRLLEFTERKKDAWKPM